MMASEMVSVIKGLPKRLPPRLRKLVLTALGVASVISVTQLGVVVGVSLLGTAMSSPEGLMASGYFKSLEPFLPECCRNNPKTVLLMVAGACVFAVLVNNCARLLSDYFNVKTAREVERFFGVRLLSGFLSLSYEWHLSKNSSDLSMSVHWATHYGTMVRSLIVIFGDLLSVIIVLAGIFVLDPWIALCTVGSLGVFAVGLFALMKSRLDYYSSEYRTTTLDNLRVVNMALQGVKDVKLFGREARLVSASDFRLGRCVNLAVRQEFFRITPLYALEVVGFLLIFALVAWLLYRGGDFAQIAGTVALLAAAGWKLLPCVNKLLGAVTSLRVSWPFVRKAEEYFAEVSRTSANGMKTQQRAAGAPGRGIALHNIDFTYQGGNKGVAGIDLEVGTGEAVGLIGPSGGGKSTLVNIISGLLSPQSGQLLVDGEVLVGEKARAWQLSSVGYVPQSPYICDATLAENVAFGLWGDEVDRDLVMECCRMAAIDFIDDLPRGLDTPIGERGVRLSGGQQQRVAIARALYKRAGIIIFDEATSALDTKSEKSIQDTIYSLKGQVTLIIVAHRLSTIEGCDRVYWIQDGRVRKTGRATEVLGAYREGGEG